ncbi:oligopeptide ABC transporter substrate-binding protein [Spiroplasma helicoides]|uniref:Oligopeptide ABC transporter substrate-binding protein n=1 Tax=Spiroplasma helicoides TaxID=216938 RepID=A0A1B3SKL3_9MOLU|nr:ABC transporter substrate-binding protein [Spiroplasma helicoides]AOG60456.1 oligopeptide ABC transporter substrate-binding protein [Spiroplasma helicoides]
MAITSKRLLSALSAISAVGLTASSVVACGTFDLSKIINRVRSDEEYFTTYQYPVESWNSSYTFKAEDHKVLANTNATALGVDEYGRVYGDIFAPNPDLSKSQVGESSDGGKTWKYSVRKNISWYKSDGTKAGDIKASDFEKAAEYILRAKTTGSQLVSLWSSFIVGAREIYLYLSNYNSVQGSKGDGSWTDAKAAIKKGFSYKTGTGSDEKVVEVKAVEAGFGLIIGDDNTVTYKLTKAAPYFESLLCYAVFSPLYVPEGEVKDVDKRADFTKGYYSGAYLPKINDGNQIVLEKNENYWFKDMVSIKKITYVNASGGTSSKGRELFESGETSGFLVNNDDSQGWNRYVGSDIEKPVFDYVYDAPTSDALASFVLFFNMYHSDIDGGEDTKKERAVKASKLLQNQLARLLISTGIDRSVFVKYFSEKFDGGSTTSKMLRNVYTAPGVAADDTGKDFSSYVEDAVKELANVKANDGSSSINLSDGQDPLLGKAKLYSGKEQSALMEELRTWMKAQGILSDSQSYFELHLLQNPDQNQSLNPKINQMFERFNQIQNNPIHLVAVDAASKEDYQAKTNKGEFDLDISGWSPDYADPGTFLNTLRVEGDMNTYTGSAKIMEVLNDKGNKNYSALHTDVSDDFVKDYQEFDKNVAKTDSTTTDNKVERFKEFAQQEASYMYKDFFMMPFYIRSAPKNYSVSYVVPYSTNYAWSYGIAGFKDWSKQLSSHIVSTVEAEAQKQRVKDYVASFKNDSNMKKDDVNERNHILFAPQK